MMTQCVQTVLTVINDDTGCAYSGPVQLLRWPVLFLGWMVQSLRLPVWFLRWCHRVILICVPGLTHPFTLCSVQKLFCRCLYLLGVLIPNNFMISWWMIFCKIIRQVMYSLFPIGIEVARFCSILIPMVYNVPVFEIFWLHERAYNSNSSFAVILEGIAVFWLQLFHGDGGMSNRYHCLSVEEHPSCFRFCFWGHNIFECFHTVRIGSFILVLGVLVVGGQSLIYKWPAMRLRDFGGTR